MAFSERGMNKNGRSGSKRWRRVERAMIGAGVVALPLGAVMASGPPASAAFNGSNGPVAFVSTRLNEGTFGGIFQVNSQAGGLGGATGDQAATTGLTNAGGGLGVDAEPFYSPSGGTVFFSSSRSGGKWAIFDIPTLSPEPPGSATELSQVPGSESHDDYSPSVAQDGRTVIFNRDDSTIDSLDAGAPTPVSTVCILYTPPASAHGLAAPNTDGGASRVLLNPTDPTQLLYVGGDNHLHLVTGLPEPSATTPTNANQCGAQSGINGVVDTDLSAGAVDSVTSSTDADGTYQDENPDWSPDGTKIIFDSTRRGTNHTLWQMTNLSSGTLVASPLWASQVGSGGGLKSATEPVYSPDGTEVAFVEQVQGANTFTGEVVGMGSGISTATDVSLSTEGNGIINDQPDWGPAQPNTGQTPEVPVELMLPGAALLLGGAFLIWEGRRRPASG
jgi:hypothetical protein